MSDPRTGGRKGMRNGFSTPGECPEGMWEQEQGRLAGGELELRNVEECHTQLEDTGQWGGREGDWEGLWTAEMQKEKPQAQAESLTSSSFCSFCGIVTHSLISSHYLLCQANPLQKGRELILKCRHKNTRAHVLVIGTMGHLNLLLKR